MKKLILIKQDFFTALNPDFLSLDQSKRNDIIKKQLTLISEAVKSEDAQMIVAFEGIVEVINIDSNDIVAFLSESINLIRAAPELFQALQELLHFVEMNVRDACTTPVYHSAKDAISKATT